MNLHFYIKFLIIISISCFSWQYGFAQDTTSTRKDSAKLDWTEVADPHTRFLSEYMLELAPDSMQRIDTSLKDLHQKYDPLFSRKNHYTGLGNNGSVSVPLFLKLPQQSGFDFGFHQWDLYRFTRENVPYFNTRTPYTDLSYTSGPVELRGLNAIHSQNILPNWNASLQFRKLANDGFYERQRNSMNNLALNTWYRSFSRRYMVAASAIWNSFEANENGGIISDTILESKYLTPGQKVGFPVKLNNTSQQFQEQNYMLKQFFYIGSSEKKKVNDSTEIKILNPSFFISHTFNYNQQRYNYRDSFPDTAYYRNNFFDAYNTKERFQNRVFSNTFSIGNIAQKSASTGSSDSLLTTVSTRNDLGYMAFAKHDYVLAKQPFLDTTFQNVTIGAEFLFPGRFGFNVRGEYIPYGYNQGDYLLRASAEAPLPLPKTIADKIKVEATVQQYEPAYIQQQIFTNHFRWNNDYKKTQAYTAAASLTAPFEVGLKAQYSVVNNLIYFDTAALPRQAGTVLQYASLSLDKDLKFWKFHLNNSLIYQKILQGDFVRFPDLSYRGSLYYEAYFFRKKVLLFQIGTDVRYTSSYAAYAYMPNISQFHLQDSVNIGNYPFIDAFINVKVKRFQGYIKLEHVNQSFTGFRYYTSPHYPLYPLTFRLGLRWMFYS